MGQAFRRRLVAVGAGVLLIMSTMVAAAAGDIASDPAPLAQPEFNFWFAPPGGLGFVSGLDANAGRVAVVDGTSNVVHIHDESGSFMRTITGPGGALGSFQDAEAVAIGNGGRVFVTDRGTDRVSVFGAGGAHKFSFGGSGSGPGLFDLPWDVEVLDGEIFVVDAVNNRVQVFDQQGGYLRSIGPNLVGGKDLLEPEALDFTSDGLLLISHSEGSTVVAVDGSGVVQAELSTGVDGRGLTIDSADRVWVPSNAGFAVFDRDFTPLGHWTVATNAPVAFKSDGQAVVGSSAESRIDVYEFYQCNNRLATYVGTSNTDFATGSAQDDVAVLLGGNDIYFGGPGRDAICGGGGADQLHGGTGRDYIYGQGGPDELSGNANMDRLFGGVGLDTIRGGTGPDWLYGGKHRDELRGGDGPDNLFGGNGPDDCYGGSGTDSATSCANVTGIP